VVSVFLLVNLVLRCFALDSESSARGILAVGAACIVGLGWLRADALRPALTIFGTSFLLFGFHSYRAQSQVFEGLVAALALALVFRLGRRGRLLPPTSRNVLLPLFVVYVGLAALSLLQLPPKLLDERLFVEGIGIGRAALGAFPVDPLYPIAAVNRLVLFLVLAVVIARQSDAPSLFRALFRGIAWAAILAVVFGLLDFLGLISLTRQNLSHLTWGPDQPARLQSTFQNPGWFACFLSLALPMVMLEFQLGSRRCRFAIGFFLPLCAASLFLSGARASWLACLVVGATLLAWRGSGLSLGRGRTALLVASSAALLAPVLVWTYGPTTLDPAADRAGSSRLERLRDDIRLRNLGLMSPRGLAATYAVELARHKPLWGLGYETYGMHIRAHAEIPSSRIARQREASEALFLHETVFDDAHNTYLQVLVGTGALGLAVWMALSGAGLLLAARAHRDRADPLTMAALLVLIAFHVYGLFQGMSYLPMTWFFFFLAMGHVLSLEAGRPLPVSARAARIAGGAGIFVLVLAGVRYADDRGYRSFKQAFGREAYLPEEAEVFEGFYRPESAASGEFRWMGRRGVIRLHRAAPFRLTFTCSHPDVEREPVVLFLRMSDRDAGSIVFRRRASVEKRFEASAPGALRLSVSRTFRPSTQAGDRRELGVAVSAIRWE
jgi:O-antigen ligase